MKLTVDVNRDQKRTNMGYKEEESDLQSRMTTEEYSKYYQLGWRDERTGQTSPVFDDEDGSQAAYMLGAKACARDREYGKNLDDGKA